MRQTKNTTAPHFTESAPPIMTKPNGSMHTYTAQITELDGPFEKAHRAHSTEDFMMYKVARIRKESGNLWQKLDNTLRPNQVRYGYYRLVANPNLAQLLAEGQRDIATRVWVECDVIITKDGADTIDSIDKIAVRKTHEDSIRYNYFPGERRTLAAPQHTPQNPYAVIAAQLERIGS